MVGRICENCGKEFEIYLQRRVACACVVCGKEFELALSYVEDGRGRFCSQACFLRFSGETSIEQMIREELEKRGEPFEQQVQFGRFHVDFVLPMRKAIIECDGIYWHTQPEVIERDHRKDALVTLLGYRVFRFDEKDIRASVQRCIDVVLNS